jgi:hypothetical protein
MEVIVHEDVRVEDNPVRVQRGAEPAHPGLPVSIVHHNRPPLIPPTGHVIYGPWIGDS